MGGRNPIIRIVVLLIFLGAMHGGMLLAQLQGPDFYEFTASDDTVPYGVEIRLKDIFTGSRPYDLAEREFGIFRSESDKFSEAVYLDRIGIRFVHGATASVIDLEASAGKYYRYWLTFGEDVDQENSSPYYNDTGYWNEGAPGPSAIQASNGISDQAVEITWRPAPGSPVAYEVSRDSDSFLERTVIGTVSGSTLRFSDETGRVARGSVPWEDDADWGYLYWVQAIYADGSRSGFGRPDRGYRSKYKVEGIEVERIDHSRSVRISWNGRPYEDYDLPYPYVLIEKFHVYRAPVKHPKSIAYLGMTRLTRNSTWNEFVDETAETNQGYLYWVRFAYVTGAPLPSGYYYYSYGSWSDPVFLPAPGIQPPENVSASDSETRFIELTWDAVPGAVRYEIYRGPPGAGFESMTLQESVSSAQTSWKDFPVEPGEWIYSIEAITYSGERSPLSLPVAGERMPPPPPDTFSASDGDHPDFVRLTWESTSDVDGFVVQSQWGEFEQEIPVMAGTTTYGIDDPSPDAGKKRTYTIRSYHLIPQPSGPPLKVYGETISDQGHRLRLPPLPGPEAVSARNVASPVGGIVIEWTPVADAEVYQIFSGDQLIGEVAEGPFIWQGGLVGWDYLISVRAWRENGGLGAEGATVAVAKASPVAGLAVAPMMNGAHLELSWEGNRNSRVDFEVLRSPTPDLADAVSVGTTTALEFADALVAPTRRHWYWVVSRVAGVPQLTVGPVNGVRPLPMPLGLVGYERAFHDYVRIEWEPLGTVTEFRVYRGTTENVAAARWMEGAEVVNFNNQFKVLDTSAVPGETYYYWVSAIDPLHGESELAGPVTGIRTEAIPPTPRHLEASDGLERDRVHLSWERTPGAIRYRILRSQSASIGDGAPIVVIKDGNVTAFEDREVRPGVTYYYFICADGVGGRSPWSEGEAGFAALAGNALDLPEGRPYEPVSGDSIDLGETGVTSRFSGVLRDPSATEHIVGDAPNLVVRTVRGRTIFSGLFRFGEGQFRVRGRFGEDGNFFTTLVPYRGAEPTSVALRLVETEDGAVVLTGTIEGAFSAILDTSAIPWHPRWNPWEDTGRFTFVMPDEDGVEACGIALAGINRAGVARWMGYTPDGARFTAVSRVGETGNLPLFARYRLPQRHFGTLAGDLEFRELEGVSDLDGAVHFRVRDEPESEQSTPILGSRFDGEDLAGQVMVSFSGVRDLENLEVTWDERNLVRASWEGGRLNLRCQRRTGMINGFWLDGATSSRLQVRAVLFPVQELVVGQYRETGGAATFRFAIEPE